MKNLINKRRKILAIASVISLVGSILVFMGNGCSGQFQVDSSSGTPGGGPGVAANPGSDIDIVPGTKTVSVVYSQQALDQLSSCAGISTPSDATLKIYESHKGAISVYGTAETITSPMMMAIVSVSGELCNDLINQETGMQRIFKGWNLAANNLPSTGTLNEAITRMALSCWQRPETSEERQLILDGVFSVAEGEAQAGRKAALMLCTSMLSSLNSILN